MEMMGEPAQHPFELGIGEDSRANEWCDIRRNSDDTEYHSPDELDDAPLVQDVRDPSSFEARRERVRNPETSGSESEDDNAELTVMPDMRNVIQRREGKEGGPRRASIQPRRRPSGTAGRDTHRHSLGSFLNTRKDAIRTDRRSR